MDEIEENKTYKSIFLITEINYCIFFLLLYDENVSKRHSCFIITFFFHPFGILLN